MVGRKGGWYEQIVARCQALQSMMLAICVLFSIGSDAAVGSQEQKVSSVPCKVLPVLRIRTGVELSWDYLQGYCEGDREAAERHVSELIKQLNDCTVAELQIYLDLQVTLVPEKESDDPTKDSVDKNLVLGAIPARFEVKGKPEANTRLDLLIKLCPPIRIGGGLAYCPPNSGNLAYYVAGFGADDGWAVMRHEFAHTLDQWHEYGFPYHNGVMGGRGVRGNPYSSAPAAGGYFSTREVEGMRRCAEKVRQFPPVGPATNLVDQKGVWRTNLPPKAMLDFVRPKRAKDGRFQGVIVDAAKNDRAANSGFLVVEPSSSGRSLRGGKVEAKGKGQLFYTPPNELVPEGSTWDHFHYILKHSNGMQDTGEVLVIFDLGDNLVSDGGFESKGSKWNLESATLQPRSPRSYLRPWRGWFQSDLANIEDQSDDAWWVFLNPPKVQADGPQVVLRQKIVSAKQPLMAGRQYRINWECLNGRPQDMHAALVWSSGERIEFNLARMDLGDQGPSSIYDGLAEAPTPLPKGQPTLEISATWGKEAKGCHLDNLTMHLEGTWAAVNQAEARVGR